jgi:hypothetical protein
MKKEENVVDEGEYDPNFSIFGESEIFVSKLRVRSKKEREFWVFFPIKFCLI